MYRITNFKTSGTDSSLLQFTGLLEVETSARAMEEDDVGASVTLPLPVNTTTAAIRKRGEGQDNSKGRGQGRSRHDSLPLLSKR